MTIKIPKAHCETARKTCFFFMRTGNYQEDFCGLYQKFTGTDFDKYGMIGAQIKKKPEFCKALSVDMKTRRKL